MTREKAQEIVDELDAVLRKHDVRITANGDTTLASMYKGHETLTLCVPAVNEGSGIVEAQEPIETRRMS